METLLYLVTAFLTIAFSVWIYLAWVEKAGLNESSGKRFILILTPSTYFLIITLTYSYHINKLIRFDLLGLMVFDVFLLIAVFALVFVFSFTKFNNKRSYIFILSLFNFFSIILIIFINYLKNSPVFLIYFSSLIRDWGDLNFFSFNWLSVKIENGGLDLVSLLNRVVIAVLSYIPISVIRFAYVRHQTSVLLKEYLEMDKRLKKLELEFNKKNFNNK